MRHEASAVAAAKAIQSNGIRVINHTLDEFDGRIVIRGVIDPASFGKLQVDAYQREVLPASKRDKIFSGYLKGDQMPDIDLGMRGMHTLDQGDSGVIVLLDPTFIIDGQQRIATALEFLEIHADKTVRLGAMIHLDTNRDFEERRFEALNKHRVKVSGNVLLRNRRENSPVIGTLFGLTTNEPDFVMHNRVGWDQNLHKGEFITAIGLAKITGFLHSHKAATLSTNQDALVAGLDKAREVFGLQTMRENVRAFFELVDECWDIKGVTYTGDAPYLKQNFLNTLARVLSRHEDFWKSDDLRLFVNADLRRKLKSFGVYDPFIRNLAAASGRARDELYARIVAHLNSGKRTQRLTSRIAAAETDEADGE